MAQRVALVGANKFRAALAEIGFRTAPSGLAGRDNRCNWYAYRRSTIAARVCETNSDKPTAQIVVYPTEIELNGQIHRSAKVNLTGEFSAAWFSLDAYGLEFKETVERMCEIESMLVRAWNNLAEDPAP